MKNLPNYITVGRMAIVPLFVFLYLQPGGDIAAVVCYAIAAASDAVDGYLARKWNVISNFGKLMDPLADKILVSAGFVLLVAGGRLPAWACILVLFREFLVTGLRALAAEQGLVMAAGASGKVKTVVQMLALPVLLLEATRGAQLGPLSLGGWMCAAIVSVTLYSGVDYIWKARGLFGAKQPKA